MKILFIAPSNSVHTQRWVKNAVNSGLEVYFYDQNPIAVNLGIEGVIEISRPLPAFFRYLPSLVLEIFTLFFHLHSFAGIKKNQKFDVVHVHWLFSSSAYSAAFAFPSKLVSTPWGSDVQYVGSSGLFGQLKKFLNRLYVRKVLKTSQLVCCDSHLLRDSLVKFGINTSKVEIIYFGTDVNRFKPQNRDDSLRSRLGFTSENVVILSNRGHEPVYDIPTLINSAPKVLSKLPNARFVIAGSGSLTSSYKEQIDAYGITNYFTFPGRLNDDDFINITASCDIYVSTSKSDGGLAASTAEAMASGLPVVISNFGENANWLNSESAGLLFPIGDSDMLTEILLRLAKDESLRVRLGSEGRKIIVGQNNSILEWNKVLDLYRRAAGTKEA